MTLLQNLLDPQHDVYTTYARRGWHGYTIPVNLHSVLTARDGRALLRLRLPSLSREDHQRLGIRHAQLADENAAAWSRELDAAALQTLGRKFEIQDYRVSAIGLDSFPEEHKARLRSHSMALSCHRRLAVFHLMAAGLRHRTALRRIADLRPA